MCDEESPLPPPVIFRRDDIAAEIAAAEEAFVEPPMIDRRTRRFTNIDDAAAVFPSIDRALFAPLLEQPLFPQHSPGWFTTRKTAITASDYGAACGVSTWSNPVQVFLKKVQTVSDEITNEVALAAMAHGTKYEDAAAHHFERVTGETLIDVGCLCHHQLYRMRPAEVSPERWFEMMHADTRPETISEPDWRTICDLRWIKGSPDGICLSGAVVEIKCPANGFVIGSPIREAYLYQLKLNMALCGATRGYFIRYMPPSGFWEAKFECVRIELEPDWFDATREKARTVWDMVEFFRSHDETLPPSLADKYRKVVHEDGRFSFESMRAKPAPRAPRPPPHAASTFVFDSDDDKWAEPVEEEADADNDDADYECYGADELHDLYENSERHARATMLPDDDEESKAAAKKEEATVTQPPLKKSRPTILISFATGD